jgi:hypothetical protein
VVLADLRGRRRLRHLHARRSELYQDLFGAGIYVGKGIYDVDAFMQSVERRGERSSADLSRCPRTDGARRDIVLFEDRPPRRVRQAPAPLVRGGWHTPVAASTPAAGGLLQRKPPHRCREIVDNLRQT